MFTLKIQNNRGELYELTHDREHYTVLNVGGLTLPGCNVNTSSAGAQDGEEYNSSHLNRRNLVITLQIEGDIETNRQKLYRIFPLHSPVTVFFKNKNRDVTIEGYVEGIEGDPFEMLEVMQISLICPHPYWEDLIGIYCEFGHELIGFSFPFNISAEGMVIAGIYQSPVQQVFNNGTADVGFVADVSVDSIDEPTLTATTETSEIAAEMRRHCVCMTAGSDASFFGNMDFGTQTVNITINGTLCASGTDYTPDLLTFPDSHKGLWLESLGPDLTNAGVSIEKIVVDGQSITDMRYWVSDTFTVENGTKQFVGVPSWFDLEKDCIVIAYLSGEVGRATPVSTAAEQQQDGTYRIVFTFANEPGTSTAECRIYGSVSKVDVHDATISRKQLYWSLYPYRNYILSPTVPAHTAMDVFRVYNGTELLESTEYSFQTVTKSDGTTAQYFELTGDGKINPAITFEVIKSIAGDDIHDYTQTQIDEGMCLVDSLTFTNMTTGASMSFPDIQFRNGDKFTISTVQGSLYVTVTESDWMPAGKSLLYEVLRHGQFFKLIPGENRLCFTADSNLGYISCSMRAKKLYGGV